MCHLCEFVVVFALGARKWIESTDFVILGELCNKVRRSSILLPGKWKSALATLMIFFSIAQGREWTVVVTTKKLEGRFLP